MKLYEFFGHLNLSGSSDSKEKSPADDQENKVKLEDDLFNYILDNDTLHKKFFMPVAKKIKNAKTDNDPKTDSHDWKIWVPMVNAGCMDYYKEHKLEKHPKEAFPKELRKGLCKRLVDHFHDDILNDVYNLGS